MTIISYGLAAVFSIVVFFLLLMLAEHYFGAHEIQEVISEEPGMTVIVLFILFLLGCLYGWMVT